jgi:UDP-glucose 4-epimerase
MPATVPIEETTSTNPVNPYGESKLAFERALHWYHHAHGFRAISLRYFNAAGATERCGERHDPETHLIPLVIDVAAGSRSELTIFGDDYPTRDGTCVRDYIHILDLAQAHILALEALERGDAPSNAYNLGCGGEGDPGSDRLCPPRDEARNPRAGGAAEGWRSAGPGGFFGQHCARA